MNAVTEKIKFRGARKEKKGRHLEVSTRGVLTKDSKDILESEVAQKQLDAFIEIQKKREPTKE